jgi:hypothetical protein
MEIVLAAIVLAGLVALVVLRPLVESGPEREAEDDVRRAELEAAKEAKYREIRDAELDRGMGKLSVEDHRVTDRELREEAIEILRELDALDGRAPRA